MNNKKITNLNVELIEQNKKETNILFIILVIILILVLFFSSYYYFNKKNNTRKISIQCEIFDIFGNVSHKEKLTLIHINDIKYCGTRDKNRYDEIEYILYEIKDNIKSKISFKSSRNIMLEDFLKKQIIVIENYKLFCHSKIYLKINCYKSNILTTYEIPFNLNMDC